MKKVLSLRIAALLVVLLTFVGVPLHQSVSATVSAAAPQSQFFPPVDFYRFIVNNTELGTLLTTNFQEGVNLNFANYPFPQTAKIAVPPAPGWTPTPGQGLIPLYRYHISQNGAFGGIPLQAYYSQTRGYFYTVGNEVPIGYPYYNGFVYHGAPCYLPQGGQFSWDPPPQCDPDGSMQQQCNNNGGTWNQNTCSCNFIGPDPCRGGARSSARPIEPCIQLIKVPPVKDNPEK
jgi:hypothetical protein